MKKKVFLTGPILVQCGYGVHSRTVLSSLRQFPDQFEIYIQALNWGSAINWLSDDDEERRFIDARLRATHEYLQQGGQFDIHVHVGIPNEFQRQAPRAVLVSALNETNKISPEWVEKMNQADQNIVISEFNKKTIQNSVYQVQNNQTGQVINDFRVVAPIKAIPYPAILHEPDQEFSKELGELIKNTSTNFLTINQVGIRKNFINTLKWFIEEFKFDEDVGLICKVHQSNMSLIDREKTRDLIEEVCNQYPDKKCKIYFLHGELNENQMASLYTHENIHGIINISHGESFGLSTFDASLYDMPVISHDWGGQTDYLYCPRKKDDKDRPHYLRVDFDVAQIQPQAAWEPIVPRDSAWAFPKEGSFKLALKDLQKNYKRHKSIAKHLGQYNRKKFTKETIYRNFSETIVGNQIFEIDVKDLPRVSLVTSVYRAAEYLPTFLEDIAKQTIFEDKIQMVFVHPKDSPEYQKEKELIDKFVEKYPNNVIYLSLEKDNGVYACWNEGIRASTGEYVGNANTDDSFRHDAVETKAKMLFMNEGVDLVYADSYITHKPNETFDKNSSGGQRYKFEQATKESLLRGNHPHHAPLWRKSLHEKYGYFDEELFSAGDWEMWLRSIFGGGKMIKIEDVLGLYYFNTRGISTNKETEQKKKQEEMRVFRKYQKLFMEED